MLRRIQQTLLIDRPLIYALAARTWQAISGPITIALIIATLTAAETGIYYSMGAIIGIQVFFELGLLNVLISQAAHSVSIAPKRDATRAKSEPITDHDRMSALIRFSDRWFLGTSLAFAITALALGWYSFVRVETALDWRTILVAFIVLAAWTLALAPSQALLEGAGKRDVIYKYRFFQAITGSIIVWITLALGFKLWALVTSSAVQLAWVIHLRYVREAKFFSDKRSNREIATDLNWSRDILPVQWRMAVMSLAYFSATQFLILIVLYFDSETAAGRLGITLNIVNAIQMFALAWVQTNFATTSIQHGTGNREAAGTHWRKLAMVSTIILVLALTSLIVLIALLPWFHRNFEDRFVTPIQLVIYSVGCLANHLIAIQSFYVLSQRTPPLTLASVIGFVTTAIAGWIGGALYGTTGLLLCYSFTMAVIGFPLHTWAYLRFRNTRGTLTR